MEKEKGGHKKKNAEPELMEVGVLLAPESERGRRLSESCGSTVLLSAWIPPPELRRWVSNT